MITLQEAEEILNVDTSVNKITQVSESANYFIFNVVPRSVKFDSERPFTPPMAVEKQTGRTLVFNPMRFSKEELSTIERIR